MTGPLEGRKFGLLTASASQLGGGVFEAVVLHAGLLRDRGARVSVFALADARGHQDLERFGPCEVELLPVKGPAQVGYAPQLLPALLRANLDCLHLHGIWMYPSAAGRRWASETGRPYFISPHGMLDPWIASRGRWKKALARVGYERASWQQARQLHALTPKEASDIARETGRTDSLIIPNPGPATSQPTADRHAHRFVYIGRIHPKKNLLNLLAAWHAITRPSDAELIIAGWGDPSSVSELERAIAAQPDCNIRYVGPIYGDDKQRLLHSAGWIVLPSLSEGLPMAILEAWAAAVPVIMTAECNLDQGFSRGAALECGYTPQAIGAALATAIAMAPSDHHAMGAAGQALANGPFSAKTVADQWCASYDAALAGDAKQP